MKTNVNPTSTSASSRRAAAFFFVAATAALGACSCSEDPETKGGAPCVKDTDCTDGDRCDPVIDRCLDPEDPDFCAPELHLCGCADERSDNCESVGIGGDDDAFDLENNDVNGVGKNDKGELWLDSSEVNTRIIWIANTAQGSVSKVDTTSFEELGRYQTTPVGLSSAGDPSRTSVNLFSDVYVGNRAHGSVTKISVLGDACPDRNGDGVVTTSTGWTDIKSWTGDVPDDECILWYTKLPPEAGVVRAMAAQEVTGLDGAVSSYIWVGGWNSRVYKLDGDTGEILLSTSSPVPPYGFALDKSGNLWIATVTEAILGRVDTTRCLDEASCDVEICNESMEADGDACIKQRVSRTDGGGAFYGITVDYKQRVWVGGQQAARYDPSEPWADRWVPARVNGQTMAGAGIGATKKFAYLSGIIQIDLEDPTQGAVLGGNAYGIAIDLDGKVWGVPQSDNVTVITPSDVLGQVTFSADPPRGFVLPYTYSDMTGSQVRFATNPRGYYRERFEGCGAKTGWEELRYTVDTPGDTSVVFRARTANTVADLMAAEWVMIAAVPPDVSPAALGAAFKTAGVTMGGLLEVEVQLISEGTDTEFVTPTVSSFAVTHDCESVVL